MVHAKEQQQEQRNGVARCAGRGRSRGLVPAVAFVMLLLSVAANSSVRHFVRAHHVEMDGSVEASLHDCELVCHEKVAVAAMSLANEKQGMQEQHEAELRSLQARHELKLEAMSLHHESLNTILRDMTASIIPLQEAKTALESRVDELETSLQRATQEGAREVQLVAADRNATVHELQSQLHEAHQQIDRLLREATTAKQNLQKAQSMTVLDVLKKELKSLYLGIAYWRSP
jgi:chromosome segregation ATPase